MSKIRKKKADAKSTTSYFLGPTILGPIKQTQQRDVKMFKNMFEKCNVHVIKCKQFQHRPDKCNMPPKQQSSFFSQVRQLHFIIDKCRSEELRCGAFSIHQRKRKARSVDIKQNKKRDLGNQAVQSMLVQSIILQILNRGLKSRVLTPQTILLL